MSLSVDVAVIGGGPAGATAAAVLARRGLSVVVLEATHGEHAPVGETLPPSVRPLLVELGLWRAFQGLDPRPSYGNQSAWGAAELRSRSFLASPHGTGWHVDRRAFDALIRAAATQAGARVVHGERSIRCTRADDGRFCVATASRLALRARGLVDASGRRASAARQLGGRREIYDHLVGVAVRTKLRPQDAGGYTLVETVEDGWWYSAPLPGGDVIAVLMTDADRSVAPLREISTWLARLQGTQHTLARLRDHVPLGAPRLCSAATHRLRRGVESGPWLAAGDAALAVDPLSSRGIQRALESGRSAALALASWLDGDRGAAERYEHALDTELARYLERRRAYYALETRWPAAPFWRRRHAPGMAAGAARRDHDAASVGQR